MSKIRILLIEDNRLLRDGIAAMINGQGDMNVVAASGGNDNAVSRELPETKVIGMDLIPNIGILLLKTESEGQRTIGLKGVRAMNWLPSPASMRTLLASSRRETGLPKRKPKNRLINSRKPSSNSGSPIAG